MANYLEEFGTEWAVPAAVTSYPAIIDISWHNDVSPSFTLPQHALPMDDGDCPLVRLWVNHPDATLREFPSGRFTVTSDLNTFYDGDDVTAALAALAAAKVEV
jgi:hypothetical protein